MTPDEQKALVDAVAAKMVQTPTPVQTGGLEITKLTGIIVAVLLGLVSTWQSSQKPDSGQRPVWPPYAPAPAVQDPLTVLTLRMDSFEKSISSRLDALEKPPAKK